MYDIKFEDAVRDADALLRVGLRTIYLPREVPEELWRSVTNVETGNCMRNGIDVSVWLMAAHPCGLQFRWSLDLEKRGADGSPRYHIDIDGIRAALRLLPAAAGRMLRGRIGLIVGNVENRAAEYQEAANEQRLMAQTLRTLSDVAPATA